MSNMPAMAEMFNGGADSAKELAVGLGSTVVGLTTALKSFTSVDTNSRGVRTRWKKVVMKDGTPVVVGPGRHFTFIGIGDIKTISIQDKSQDLDTITVDREYKNKLTQLSVRSSVVWNVINDDHAPYRALYNVDDLAGAVANTCSSELGNTIRTIDEKYLYNEDMIREKVLNRCAEPLYEWGVQLKRFDIRPLSRTLGEMVCEAARIGSEGPDRPSTLLVVPEAS